MEISMRISIFVSCLLFITLSNSVLSSSSSTTTYTQAYTEHCSHIISDHPLSSYNKPHPKFLQLTKGYYKGGGQILGQLDSKFDPDLVKVFFFSTYGVRSTVEEGVFQFDGSLYFHGSRKINSSIGKINKLGRNLGSIHKIEGSKKFEPLIGKRGKLGQERVAGARNLTDTDLTSENIYSVTGGKRKLGELPVGQPRINFRSNDSENLEALISVRRELGQFRIRGPKFPIRERGVSFKIHGFWDAGSGQACMVGSGISRTKEGINIVSHSVVYRLSYLNSSNLVTSLVNGVLESLDSDNTDSYFEPISVIGVSEMNYEYTLIDREMEKGSFAVRGGEIMSLGLEMNRTFCGLMRFVLGTYKLEYGRDCDSVNCNPLGRGVEFVPTVLSFTMFQCSEGGGGKVRLLIKFSNSSRSEYRSLVPEMTLIGEGMWDQKRNQLSAVACRILNSTDSLVKARVGDCSIMLNLKFPAIMTLKNRSNVVGEIWSSKAMNESSYFGRLRFMSSWSKTTSLPGLKYEYSRIEDVRSLFPKKKTTRKGPFPSGYSADMNFDMRVKNMKGQRGWGYASPFFVGNRLHEPRHANQVNDETRGSLNISYRISFSPRPTMELGGETFSIDPVEISAEGTYDTETGILCMIGCRNLILSNGKSIKNDSTDCEVLLTVQFPSLNSKGRDHVKGKIESKRNISDPFHFDHLELSSLSIYENVAAESIWRMDIEITLVLISNTLVCVFVGWQLYYVKKYPEMLPFISIVMLIVITLGYMIPLVLNFEAMFVTNHNRQNLFLDNSGWLEINEVIVRVVTMVAFLLQCRLLQLTWSSRQNSESQKQLRMSEKRVLSLSLPLYVLGALIACLAYLWKSHQNPMLSHGNKLLQIPYSYRQQSSVWSYMKSYGGLVLDCFLLPQILFNLFLNSKEQSLSFPFYMGTTFVRLLPHAYDLYRAHSSSTQFFSIPFIYANPRSDFYSTAWDVVIPCGCLSFALIIFMQQRYGGHCILPKKFRRNSEYEKVPVVTTD